MARVAVLTALVATAASSYAQIPAASSARSIPTEFEQSEVRVTQIIARAEDHFRKGKLNLEDSKREQAREEFDKAVDSILESGFDVRASQKLQTYYLELVERIYREEVPLQQPVNASTSSMQVAQNTQTQEPATQKAPPSQIGFRDQKFEPSPLDELSKLVFRAKIFWRWSRRRRTSIFRSHLIRSFSNTSITTRDHAAARRWKTVCAGPACT
jgi:membrane-bound lytic murein transglycosylase D